MKQNNESWEKYTLQQLAEGTLINGIFNDPKKVGKGVPLINVVDLYERNIDFSNLTRLVVSEKELENYSVKEGDILFTRSSLKLDGIAHCNIVKQYPEDTVFDCHLVRLRPKKSIVNSSFLFRLCQSTSIKAQLMKNAKTTTMTTIDQKGIYSVMVNLPPLAEQARIAEILSTQDRLIELQEKLINQKQQQKKYLMQMLLTGKKRLHGFNDMWEEKKLGDITKYGASTRSITSIMLTHSKITYPIYDANTIIGYVDDFDIEQEYISIVKDGAGVGRLHKCVEKSSVIGTMGYILANENIDVKFLFQKMSLIDFTKYINGSTIPHLYYKDYSKMKLTLPPLPEQQAIADILTKADEEIELLKKQLAQLKLKQKAMQQLLLTGIVRVHT